MACRSRPRMMPRKLLPVIFLSSVCVLSSAFGSDFLPSQDGQVEYQADFSSPHTAMSDTNFTILPLSTSPLLIYLSSFLAPDEVLHLLHRCQDSYTTSPLITTPSSDTYPPPPTYRTSTSCTLPNDDHIIVALTLRVYNFLHALNIEADGIEPFQAFDTPIFNSDNQEYNLLASFFLYLEANCSASGGTYFPRISVADDVLAEEERDGQRFGRGEDRKGVILRPVVGNGVFWVNLKRDGDGDERVLHAGLPVEGGSKTGLNIWVTKLKVLF
ncbi:hypothetical protein DL98DRAFT_566610 [Cadophora sp. DSE1049]|nr:hypothetical protein DL98DRAFT_566610 [Cadophora sp. DSE1049]